MRFRAWLLSSSGPELVMAVSVAILVAVFVWSVWGCVDDPRIHEIEQTVAKIQSDIAVGGGGDSVTSWIYALGAAIVYPAIRVLSGGSILPSKRNKRNK